MAAGKLYGVFSVCAVFALILETVMVLGFLCN